MYNITLFILSTSYILPSVKIPNISKSQTVCNHVKASSTRTTDYIPFLMMYVLDLECNIQNVPKLTYKLLTTLSKMFKCT
jgi:hypothetical protein